MRRVIEEKSRREQRKSQRKKMPAREKVENVDFPMICGSRGSKSRLAKAAGQMSER